MKGSKVLFFSSDDSNSASKLMTDFSNFCSNRNGLLEEFWRNNSNRTEDLSESDDGDEETIV